MIQAFELSVFGNKGHTAVECVYCGSKMDVFSEQRYFTAVFFLQAEYSLHRFASPRTDKSCKTEYFALSKLERNILYHIVIAQMFDAQNRFTGGLKIARIILFQRPSHHHRDEFVARYFVNVRNTGETAVAEHCDSVADFPQLAHLMRNIDDPDAALYERPHDIEQKFDFPVGYGRSRFVHDENFRVI